MVTISQIVAIMIIPVGMEKKYSLKTDFQFPVVLIL